VNWRETLRTGLEAIRAHRLRSGLTMLGILIGIAAVILTVGLGEGASAQIRAQINSLGTNLLIITPGSATSAGGVNGPLGSATTLSVQDAGALASKVAAPDIAVVAPTSQAPQTLIAGTANWSTNMVGTTPGWLEARARTVAEGRFLTAADENGVAAVTVLGPTTAKKLFGTSDPLGQDRQR
jgi:putative ABC transport system permease protein